MDVFVTGKQRNTFALVGEYNRSGNDLTVVHLVNNGQGKCFVEDRTSQGQV